MFRKIQKLVYDGGGSRSDAKDLLQDTVILFFTAVRDGKYNQTTDLDAYLYTIARNRWINKAVRDKRTTYGDVPQNLVAADPSPLHGLYSKERAVAIRSVLEQVGERCKELLMMLYFEEKSTKEIIDEMGYANADAVKTRHYKCKQRMVSLINGDRNYKELLSNV
jgi:RNA polymerase sigma factor (sigma-70 family)